MRSELARLVARSGEALPAVFGDSIDTSTNDQPRFRV
jgi:hypothetical protein